MGETVTSDGFWVWVWALAVTFCFAVSLCACANAVLRRLDKPLRFSTRDALALSGVLVLGMLCVGFLLTGVGYLLR